MDVLSMIGEQVSSAMKVTGKRPEFLYIGGVLFAYLVCDPAAARTTIISNIGETEVNGLKVIRTKDDFHLSVGYRYANQT